MTLTCPNCGEQITAENINVQKLIAVCHNCDSVFSFDTPDTLDNDGVKAKRRKVKKPQHLQLNENDSNLHMAFRTNWRLERDESFTTGLVMAMVLSFPALLLTQGFIEGKVPIFVPGFMGLIVLSIIYMLALIVYNATHIEMDHSRIKVSRKPLPGLSLLNQGGLNEVSLSGVTDFQCEETDVSKREQYDTPRYRVWANMVDGNRRTIVTDVTEEYAYFITQRLEAHLHDEPEIDASRISYTDTDYADDIDYIDSEQAIQQNKGT